MYPKFCFGFGLLVFFATCLCLVSAHVRAAQEAHSLHPFLINVSKDILDDLDLRLSRTILPTPLESLSDEEAWDYGAHHGFLSDLISYWKNEYNWRSTEDAINRELQSQYTTVIQGLSLHFVFVKSQNNSAIPLILSHGWPGSVLECRKILPLLIGKFHVVCPSIPGYGFSEAPKRKGFGVKQVAFVYMELMKRLGFEYYIAQGGDWGSEISKWLGILDPACRAVHLNMLIVQPPISGLVRPFKTLLQLWKPEWFFGQYELQSIHRMQQYLISGSAYMFHQATKPDSLAFALVDSPSGLLAYLLEKFWTWSDIPDGNLLEIYTKDELLDFVMIYWVTHSIGSSMRLYKETVPPMLLEPIPQMSKPMGVAAFKDIAIPPKEWAEYYFNVVSWTVMPKGGHFAATESPELLANDIIRFSEKLEFCNESNSKKTEL